MVLRDKEPVRIRRYIQDYDDPYLSTLKPDEVAVCQECRSVYTGGRWELEDKSDALLKAENVTEVLCPACRKIKDHVPGGVATFSGKFLEGHTEEILNLFQHENRKSMEINPLERIIDIEHSDSTITVLTTNEKLAQKLGRAVYKAYNGQIEYQWPEDGKLARVYWSRDDAGSSR